MCLHHLDAMANAVSVIPVSPSNFYSNANLPGYWIIKQSKLVVFWAPIPHPQFFRGKIYWNRTPLLHAKGSREGVKQVLVHGIQMSFSLPMFISQKYSMKKTRTNMAPKHGQIILVSFPTLLNCEGSL